MCHEMLELDRQKSLQIGIEIVQGGNDRQDYRSGKIVALSEIQCHGTRENSDFFAKGLLSNHTMRYTYSNRLADQNLLIWPYRFFQEADNQMN